MRVGGVRDNGIGGDKPSSGGGVKPSVHVDEAEAVVVQVAGEAAFGKVGGGFRAPVAAGGVAGGSVGTQHKVHQRKKGHGTSTVPSQQKRSLQASAPGTPRPSKVSLF